MKDVKTQSVHVQIITSEAVDSKRSLLETELHLLNILKAMISIKELRKTEFKLKTEARTKMRELSKEIDKVLANLPVSEGIIVKGTARKKLFEIESLAKETKEKKEKIKIDDELREIRKQLEKLGA